MTTLNAVPTETAKEQITSANDAAFMDAVQMGGKAGLAARQRDVARGRMVRDHFRRWLALQPAESKRMLDDAYNAGYTEGYGSLYL